MPAYITHHLLGEGALEKVAGDPIKELVKSNRAAYDWGCQGPDLLFFYRVYQNPLNRVIQTGIKMHRSEMVPLLNAFLQYLWRSGRGERETAYALGFITHYALDSTAHPYVYALVKKRQGRTPSFARKGLHHQIESAIDTLVCREKWGIAPAHFPLFRRMGEEELHHTLAPMLRYAALHGMGKEVEVTKVIRAFHDTLFCEEFLLNPQGLPQKLADGIDRWVLHSNLLKAMCKPSQPPFDVMNEEGKAWIHPDTGEESCQSFAQLFDAAADRAAALMGEFWHRLTIRRPFPHREMPGFDNGSGRLAPKTGLNF